MPPAGARERQNRREERSVSPLAEGAAVQPPEGLDALRAAVVLTSDAAVASLTSLVASDDRLITSYNYDLIASEDGSSLRAVPLRQQLPARACVEHRWAGGATLFLLPEPLDGSAGDVSVHTPAAALLYVQAAQAKARQLLLVEPDEPPLAHRQAASRLLTNLQRIAAYSVAVERAALADDVDNSAAVNAALAPFNAALVRPEPETTLVHVPELAPDATLATIRTATLALAQAVEQAHHRIQTRAIRRVLRVSAHGAGLPSVTEIVSRVDIDADAIIATMVRIAREVEGRYRRAADAVFEPRRVGDISAMCAAVEEFAHLFDRDDDAEFRRAELLQEYRILLQLVAVVNAALRACTDDVSRLETAHRALNEVLFILDGMGVLSVRDAPGGVSNVRAWREQYPFCTRLQLSSSVNDDDLLWLVANRRVLTAVDASLATRITCVGLMALGSSGCTRIIMPCGGTPINDTILSAFTACTSLQMQGDRIEASADGIAGLDRLQSLKLQGCTFPKGLFATLHRRGHVSLQEVSIAAADMTTADATGLADVLRTSGRLQSLQLSRMKRIGARGWKSIFDALHNTRSLRSLVLDDLGLATDEMRSLVSSLNHLPLLERLSLDNNSLGNAGLLVLLPALEACTRLSALSISNVHCERAGAQALAKMMKKSPQLTQLIVNNLTEHDEDIAAVVNQLVHARHLQELQMARCSITPTSAASLFLNLRTASKLTELHVSDNSLGEAGAHALAEALAADAWPGLKVLRLSNCGVNDDGNAVVLAGLQHVPQLQVLDIGHCSLGPAGVSALARGIAATRALSELKVSSCRAIGAAAARELAMSLQVCPQMTRLAFITADPKDFLAPHLQQVLLHMPRLQQLELGRSVTPDGRRAVVAGLRFSVDLNLLTLHVTSTMDTDDFSVLSRLVAARVGRATPPTLVCTVTAPVAAALPAGATDAPAGEGTDASSMLYHPDHLCDVHCIAPAGGGGPVHSPPLVHLVSRPSWVAKLTHMVAAFLNRKPGGSPLEDAPAPVAANPQQDPAPNPDGEHAGPA